MRSFQFIVLRYGLLLVLVACNSSAPLTSASPTQTKPTLADELVNAGIICLQFVPNKGVLAATYSLDYVSIDGGITWLLSNPNDPHEHPACADKYFREPKQLIYRGLGSPDVSYSFYPDVIRRSGAGHLVSTDEFEINPPVTFYDVGYDKMTGHIIAAIGRDGVLVRTPDAAWHFVTVGPYAR